MIKIVLYISETREYLLDGIINKHFLMMEKVKANNLNNFVISSGKNLTHATHLVIDLTTLNDNGDELISSMNMLKKLYLNLRIIVLADNNKINMDLLRRMYDKGIYDIIQNVDDAELEKSILQGKSAEEAKEFFVKRPDLSSDEKQRDLELKRIAEEQQLSQQQKITSEKEQIHKPSNQKIVPNKDFRKYKPYVSVAMCGVENHVGTTHNALLITKFLADIGFKACYLEAHEPQKIFYLKSFYPQNSNFNQRKCLLQCFGIDIYSGFQISHVMAENYDFYVFDLGVLTPEKLTSFMTKDIRIIVSGSRAWELNVLGNAIELVGLKNQVYFLLNFLHKDEESKLYDFMNTLKSHTFMPEYISNPFQGGVNMDIYKTIFSDYLLQEEKPQPQSNKKKGLFKFI